MVQKGDCPGNKSGGGLELCREYDDLNKCRGRGLGGMRVSVGSFGWFLEPEDKTGFETSFDELCCPSFSCSSFSFSTPAS